MSGYAACLLIFAWEYNADILIRCLLICFGLSLVANGIFSARELRPAALPPGGGRVGLLRRALG